MADYVSAAKSNSLLDTVAFDSPVLHFTEFTA